MIGRTEMGSPRATLEALRAAGHDEVEVFSKQGRSRITRFEPGFAASQIAEQRGWAVRAGGARSVLTACGTGEPPAVDQLPAAVSGELRLPQPQDAAGGRDAGQSSDFETALIGEDEALGLLSAVDQALGRELQGARLLWGALDDGYSRAEVINGHGVEAHYRSRVASVRLAARLGRHEARLRVADRHARRLSAPSLARRLGDRLMILDARRALEQPSTLTLIAPEVAAELIAALSPYLIGEEAGSRLHRLIDSRGRVGSTLLTLVDDGGLAGGLFEAPVDGEGVPTDRVVLIAAGEPRQTLLPWSASGAGHKSGCRLRPSFRDWPELGPTHLFVEPDPKQAVAPLIGDMAHGFYCLGTSAPPRVDLDAATFFADVWGFEVRSGKATVPVANARLFGAVADLLGGIVAVGRDLRFVPSRGCVGSPSLLVSGLEIAAGC